MDREFYLVDQGTDEWLQMRCSRITGSRIADAMGGTTTARRNDYMYEIASEYITGQPTPKYKNKRMEQGNEMEPIALELYQNQTGSEVSKMGFITYGEWFGISPDGLLEDNGMIEIKNRDQHIQAKLLCTGKVPIEAVKQMNYGMYVSGRNFCDYISYCPNMPLFVQRFEFNKSAIHEQFDEKIKTFIDGVTQIIQKIEDF